MRRRLFTFAPATSWVLFLAALAALATYSYARTRPLKFDSPAWKSAFDGRVVHGNARYRMSADLMNRVRSGGWDYPKLIDLLGSPAEDSSPPYMLRYDLGRRPRGPIDWNQFYLRIDFSPDGLVTSANVYPE